MYSCPSRNLLNTFIVRFYKLNVVNKIHGKVLTPDYDSNYLLNDQNLTEIKNNISKRKGIGNIDSVIELNRKMNTVQNIELKNLLRIDLEEEMKKIPNKTHPQVLNNASLEPVEVKLMGKRRTFNFKPRTLQGLTAVSQNYKFNMLRTRDLQHINGNRSYYFIDDLADLEQALIRYTLKKLVKLGFIPMTVPDIVHPEIFHGCGMETQGVRTLVFSINSPFPNMPLCLTGTSEVSLGGFLAGKCFNENELPKRMCAYSRCYRGEVSFLPEEREGVYRVHEFTKVEMFGVTNETNSDCLLEEFCDIQQNILNELNLHFKVLDMPPHELGASAYRKFDIEAWFYGRKMFGELTSASNCTDYQSRRLGIKYEVDNALKHVHTVNGTACAIPRLLTAIVEQYQNKDKSISVPEVLVPFLNGKTLIEFPSK